MAKIEKNTFAGGFTVHYNDGTTERFTQRLFGSGYVGDNGNTVKKDASGRYTSKGERLTESVFGSGLSAEMIKYITDDDEDDDDDYDDDY